MLSRQVYPRIVRLSEPVVSQELQEIFSNSNVCATVGNFDGLHLGHCALFSELSCVSREYRNPYLVVVTFRPYPRQVLGNGYETKELLTCIGSKLGILSYYGINCVVVIRFTKSFASMGASDFLRKYFIKFLRVKHLVVGYNWGFGKNRFGGVGLLKNFCNQHNVNLSIVQPVEVDGIRVSSSAVRELLRQGKVKTASKLLGRFYSVMGRVLHGSGRGAKIGFPTANLFHVEGFVPKNGVYACFVDTSDGCVYEAVVNIGVRPTFRDINTSDVVVLEAYILTQKALSLYGTKISVRFVERLRDELQFKSTNALQEAISHDIQVANSVFQEINPARMSFEQLLAQSLVIKN